jgi:D-inositol-3-phosphate glycosyltransferase
MVNKRPLRVAMLSVHTCPLAAPGGKKTGGMNVYVRELGVELGRRGIYVDIFTRSQDPCIPHVNESDLGSKTRVIHIPAGPESPLPTSEIYPHLPEFVEGVKRFASQERIQYDLIHSHYWLSGCVAVQLKQAWGIPVLQMFHTLGRMKNRIAQSSGQLETDLRVNTEQQLMHEVDYLVAATPAERMQLMWLYDAPMRRIKVIPPGVDINHFRPVPPSEARQIIGMPANEKMLLFVGRIEPLKGVDTLMQAIALLYEQVPDRTHNLYLAIIGGDVRRQDAEMAHLHDLREELGLREVVAFLGARSQDTLHYYYSAAEAVIMPSHYESFGMVALEAMACGTPVVASEVGGLAYLVQDGVTGFHVPDRDPGELAAKIRLLLENECLRQEMADTAVRYAQQYSWHCIAAQIHNLYADATPHRASYPVDGKREGLLF